MAKYTRYQGAIVRDGHILLLQQADHRMSQSYWLLPGGKREPGETELQCVQREMLEEVRIHVRVERLLLDEPIESEQIDRRKTYLCTVVGGEPQPGYETEEEYADRYSFTAVQWLNLSRPANWPVDVVAEKGILLQAIRHALGYADGAAARQKCLN
jgi:8-oxo-dGTP pyrophosphatase MutT (NUDIX family)